MASQSRLALKTFLPSAVAGAPKPNRLVQYVPPPSQEEANRIYSQYRLAYYHDVVKDRNARTGELHILLDYEILDANQYIQISDYI